VRQVHIVLVIVACLAGSLTLAACGGHHRGHSLTPAADAAGTVWLCQPSVSPDPCVGSVNVTSLSENGTQLVTKHANATNSPYDCFYVYPTVSTQPTDNANLQVQAGEIGAAVSQASPFSQDCRVYAPMYRQRTEQSLALGLGSDPAADEVAYRSVLAGWLDYLKNYNDGRPIIFIGHSQGAAMLIRLLASQVDNDPAVRSRVVAAILLGGNVTVRTGQLVGGSFQHLPLCSSTTSVGCVIAYSTFPGEPPSYTNFGRPGQGVSLQVGNLTTRGVHVACVNPASIAGGTADLTPWFVTNTQPATNAGVKTQWVTYPGLYTASCQSSGGATWLQITPNTTPSETRPIVTEVLGPAWGFHLDDVNLALGNLVSDVAALEQAYQVAHR
jgi:hypothetical protein